MTFRVTVPGLALPGTRDPDLTPSAPTSAPARPGHTPARGVGLPGATGARPPGGRSLGRGARGGPGYRGIGPARAGHTHRAAGESFPGAPAEHGRAPPASSAVRRSVRTTAARAGRLGGHLRRAPSAAGGLSPPRSPRLAPEHTPPPPPSPVPLALPPAGPSLSPGIPPPSLGSPRGPRALPVPPRGAPSCA